MTHPAIVKSKGHSYPALRYWHFTSGSFDPYVEMLAKEAEQESAPPDVIYKRDDRTWATVRDLAPDHPFRLALTKAEIEVGQ